VWADASGKVITGVLTQLFEDGLKHPITFWSQKMTAAEQNYGIPDQELLALWSAIMTWRRYLEGAHHKVTVFTDHTNLQTFNTTMNLNRRQVQ
jgi:hypothetical protein